ncbi:MarR family winged helix-turn-helix transcriptional regulator [Streptomyces sp. NBC_00582]|uniref:MarR family winged helix-turn-helix transcriptional regulator n=1 Tax=Streptomyces sp. NBC_00582 TaxID=2975783 RepID=UPI0010E4687E|nr:MarR family transcriptional regulator [Streptomyces sp. NBC_00582]WUB59867.1 MarR family transcriptional regulator [Streptomyces sp. NBC_00582]
MECARDSDDRGGRETAARHMADAVESLVACWLAAAEEAVPRLPARQLLALRTVRRRPELNVTALAEDLGIGVPTASRLCDRLEAAGLLERTVQPRNRREVQLVLTAYGRRVLTDVTERRVRRLAAVFAGMTPAQRTALEQGLHAFRHAHTRDG